MGPILQILMPWETTGSHGVTGCYSLSWDILGALGSYREPLHITTHELEPQNMTYTPDPYTTGNYGKLLGHGMPQDVTSSMGCLEFL